MRLSMSNRILWTNLMRAICVLCPVLNSHCSGSRRSCSVKYFVIWSNISFSKTSLRTGSSAIGLQSCTLQGMDTLLTGIISDLFHSSGKINSHSDRLKMSVMQVRRLDRVKLTIFLEIPSAPTAITQLFRLISRKCWTLFNDRHRGKRMAQLSGINSKSSDLSGPKRERERER